MENISHNFQVLIYLLCCAVNGKKADPQKLKDIDFDKILKIAKSHKVSALIETVLEPFFSDEKLFSPEKVKDWKTEKLNAVRVNMLFDSEKEKVFDLLEKNKIWYMPLKGCILSRYYPDYGIRQMGDVDVLIDSERAEDIKNIMNQNGYQTDSYGEYHHDSYKKKPFYTFEMHRVLLMTKNHVWNEYYTNVKEKLIKLDNKNYEYRFSDEDFYIFFVLHSLKHFKASGTGIRTLADMYLYTNQTSLDFDYIETEFRKLDILDEEKSLRKLSEKIFSPESVENPPELDQSERDTLNFILRSGVYGTLKNKVNKDLSEISGENVKWKYAFKRIFIVPEVYSMKCPFLYNHKITRPLLFFVRLYSGLTKNRKKLISEWKILKKL